MSRYVRVSPPASKYKAEDVVFIDTEDYPISGLALAPWLNKGEPFNNEDVFNDRIANAKMSDYGASEQEATQAVHEEVGQEWVELLNYAVNASGAEVGENCTFELVAHRDCPKCGEMLDQDCNGQERCPDCDPPCPCCYDGGGPI